MSQTYRPNTPDYKPIAFQGWHVGFSWLKNATSEYFAELQHQPGWGLFNVGAKGKSNDGIDFSLPTAKIDNKSGPAPS